ncbi:MAG: SHOCT domain-containing protein [Actinomycetota bacterium]|nr:SHOCT domain-containing protein [Actinomycetota bacterium]
MNIGHLVITTHWLRWLQVFPTKHHDFWPLDTFMEFDGGVMPIIRLGSGHQFQVKYGAGSKQFVDLYQSLQHAMSWDEEHLLVTEWNDSPSTSTATTGPPGGIVAALEQLVAMRDRGILSEDEFQAAKRRVLEF